MPRKAKSLKYREYSSRTHSHIPSEMSKVFFRGGGGKEKMRNPSFPTN